MVERGARNLVLLGRSEPSAAAQAVLERLQASGARILAARGDVADAERLRTVLADAERTMPPLRGVIHSAGALDDGVLLHQTWQRFETVMAAKVVGSWNLHLLTRDRDLDFFVLFSSGVGLLGAAGQGNHAAANAFVDALAYRRRAQGLPALTINWGAWAEIGAAADHGLAERGTRTFSPEQGLRALEIGMTRAAARGDGGTAPLSQLAVLAVDWPGMFASLPPGAEPPLFRELRRAAPVAPAQRAASPAPEPQLLERLAAARPNRKAALLQEHLRGLAAQVLGVGDVRRIDVHQPLQELGLDSLMAVELRNRIAADVARSLPATLLFEHPSVGALSAALLEDLFGAAETAADPPEADTPPAPGTEPATSGGDTLPLSEDDVAMLLLKKLESLEAGQ